MAWKCSLELTHVYNIYCGNTPSRAPQLHRSIRSHKPLWVLRNTSEGRGSIWVNLLSRRNSVIRNSAASFTFSFFFYDARYRRITPPTDPARRNIGSPYYLSDPLSIRLSVCLSPFLPFIFQSENSRVRKHAHGDVRRRHMDFYLRLPLSLARKYFLGSPLIYHNRRLSTRSKLWTPGHFTPFARRAIARVRNQLRP